MKKEYWMWLKILPEKEKNSLDPQKTDHRDCNIPLNTKDPLVFIKWVNKNSAYIDILFFLKPNFSIF